MKPLTVKLFIIVLFLFANNLFAQPDTSTTQKLLQYIFQPIDKSQVPTGFLEEYGCPILPMETFNGTLTDSNRIDMNLWRTLYLQLQTGYCQTGTNPLPAITTVNTTIKQNAASNSPVPIPLLIGQFNTVRSDAFTANLLSYHSNTNQIFDVPGRPQSPYQLNNLFAACPNKKQTIRGVDSFVCKSNLIWNNTGKSISQIQIDFANGQGFQTITIGIPIAVSYTDTGYKRWTIKVTLSDNTVMQCYNDYYALKAFNNGARFGDNPIITPPWGIINVNSGAVVSIAYSVLSNTNTLRKPLIVVEGYDVSHIAPSLQDDYTIIDLIAAINDPFVAGYDFNHQLDDVAGYDLVFVNFNDGTDDIVRNAAVVQEVINQVNAHKVLDDRFGNIRQQNVVMGLSMGGLVARYALANMTKNFPGTPTETRLFITHDSPHRGANVPLGLQYLIRMMGGFQLFGYNIYDIYPDYNDAINLLGAPATQQLLLYRSLTANTFAANTFLDGTYRSMITFAPTDPQPTYRFIATSLGNECAHNLFNPGKTFINLGAGISAGITGGRILFFKIPILTYKLAAEVEAYALPNTGLTSKIARLYTINNLKLFGLINIFKQLYNNTAYAPGNHLAIDGVPGSSYPLLDIPALNELSSFPIFNRVSLYVVFPLGPFFGGYFGAYAYNSGVSFDFTFVSVGSALDVNPYNANTFTERYVNGLNQSYPSSSQTFIAQETVTSPSLFNNAHIRFTARNSHWLYNEMEGINPNNQNCSGECTPLVTISGADLFCTSSAYQILNLASGTVTWSSSPSNIISITPIGNGYSATASKISAGNVTITATTNCGQQITKAIHVGGYSSGDYPVSGPSSACRNSYVTYTTPTLAGATSYTWFYPGGGTWTYVSGQNTPSLTLITGSATGNFQVGVRVANACDAGGSYAIKNTFVNSCGGFSFRASPNPSTNTLTVSTESQTSDASTSSDKIYQIKVIDQTGKVKKQFNYSGGVITTTIDISNLVAGIYTLQAFNGSTWASQQVVKQ